MEHIIGVGNFCLYMFLGMAMVSLKLWELQSLALPLVVILVSQPFLIVPVIGAMFADLINTVMITFFLNILK